MFAIDSANSVNGKFQDGNPSTGLKGTLVSADWLNAVQEEILNVIRSAGITPDKNSDNQLLSALCQPVFQNCAISIDTTDQKLTTQTIVVKPGRTIDLTISGDIIQPNESHSNVLIYFKLKNGDETIRNVNCFAGTNRNQKSARLVYKNTSADDLNVDVYLKLSAQYDDEKIQFLNVQVSGVVI